MKVRVVGAQHAAPFFLFRKTVLGCRYRGPLRFSEVGVRGMEYPRSWILVSNSSGSRTEDQSFVYSVACPYQHLRSSIQDPPFQALPCHAKHISNISPPLRHVNTPKPHTKTAGSGYRSGGSRGHPASLLPWGTRKGICPSAQEGLRWVKTTSAVGLQFRFLKTGEEGK